MTVCIFDSLCSIKMVLTGGLNVARNSSLRASLRGQLDSTLNPSCDSPHVGTIHVHACVHTNIWRGARTWRGAWTWTLIAWVSVAGRFACNFVAGGFACNFVSCNFPILLILWMQNLDYSVSVTSLKSTSLLLILQKMQGNAELHLNAPQWMVDVNCVSWCLANGFWSVFFISGGMIRRQTSTPTSARRRTKCNFIAFYW